MTSPLQEPPASRRLDHLDGLRAVAALYVVVFHAGVCFVADPLPGWARAASRLLAFGHEAVAVFIVLSGYCLMLPAARAGGRLAHGVRGYFARRAWRILPPYFAALLGSLAVIALVPALRSQAPSGTIWDDSHPAFTTGAVVSHLLLVHNLSPDWAVKINGPLWSVATEWQIYFFLPFLLLPLWRRLGPLALLGGALALGYLPLLVAPAAAHAAVSWYLGLFAMGMVAAAIGCADRPLERRLREVVPWGRVALGLCVACALGGLVLARVWFRWKPITDPLVGLATAALLVHCGLPAGARVRRLLSAPAAVQLGHFSYSLYLVHLPVVAGGYFLVRRLSLGPVVHVGAMLLLTVPASLGVAYLFHRLIERRFMPSSARPPRP
jgi:peptidoglycan/LPS O-acetylase OafA/YrhL